MAERSSFSPRDPEWYGLVVEPVIDPERPIVDPHHHLWRRPGMDYLLEELREDTESGHNVEKTVFVAVSYTHLTLPTKA